MGRRATFTHLLESERLLSNFFKSSNVGLAILDHQLRYRMLNPYLAASHGATVESHLGRHIREILGESIARQVEPAIQQVFATGRPVVNCAFGGALPTKPGGGHWIDTFFPITDSNGRVKRVGAVVVEVEDGIQVQPMHTPHVLDGILRSWKNIAQYVGTSVKTVQRWERTYKFPVRRVRPSKGAVVFALKDELDNWLRARGRNEKDGDKHS
jgi:PAS domain S-box-containing protein